MQINQIVKRYLPYFILIISCLLFSLDFRARFDLPIHDESVYAQGLYSSLFGWAPLYQLSYFILNSFTNSLMDSFDIILFSFTFILFPSAIYGLARKINFSPEISAIVAFICLISPWNFPVDPKVEIFNMTWLALALIIRLGNLQASWRLLLFYFMMVISLYLRQDNFVVLFIVSLYDLIEFIRNRTWRKIVYLLLTIIITLGFCYTFFKHFPFDSSRSWYAFRDHFRWRNASALTQLIAGEGNIYDKINIFFKGAQSIPEAFLARPDFVARHFLNNAVDFVPGFFANFKLLLNPSPFFIWLFLILMLWILNRTDKQNTTLPHIIPVAGIAFFIKALTMAILLQPSGKYIFEANIAFLFGTCWFIGRLKPLSVPRFLNYCYLILPFLLFFHPFKQKQLENKFDIRQTLQFLQQESTQKPIKVIISVDGISNWLSKPRPIDLWNDRHYDQGIKNDMNLFLLEQKVDTIVFDPNLRWLLSEITLKNAFTTFEEKHKEFGFYLLKGRAFEGLTIYRRKNEI
jgi:hypothetical protein